MSSVVNEAELNRALFHLHQQASSSQPRGLSSLDSDLFSDPANLISLVLYGSDNHGISSARRHERQRVYGHLTQEELLNTLIDKEYEARRLSKILRAAVLRINSQAARITELEHDSQEALERLRQINQSRIEAQQDASRANQELGLYRIQLEEARRELARADEMFRVLRQQREEAEEAASRARERTRRLRQERLVDAARAEGRRWGFSDGFERAKQGFAGNGNILSELPASDPLYVSANRRAAQPDAEDIDDGADSTRSSTPEIRQPTEVRLPSVHLEPTIHDPFSGPPNGTSGPPTFFNPPPQPQPRPAQDLHPPNPPQPIDVTLVTQPDRPARPVDMGIQTPGISVFRVDLSDAPREQGITYHDPSQQSNVPNDQWVTAQQHPAFNTPSRMQSQTRYGPSPDQAGPSHSQRPSLSSQDEKKKSWYRSFSFRNKFGKRRVLDPDPTREAPVSAAEGIAADSEEDIYENPRPPSVSWYHPKGTSLGTRGSRHRTSSFGSGSTSTHMSNLQLIKTPAPILSRDINSSNGSLSVRSGKDASMIKKLREKESLLSVINEDPMSREHTPMTDRFAVDATRVPNMHHFASSSTLDSQLARGPIVLSDSRYPALGLMPGPNGSSGRHRRAVSDVTPPVTIDIQTPTHSRSSSENPRHNDELPNRFLSPSLASQPLPRPSSADRFRTNNGTPSSRTRPHTPSHQTPAMNVRESYLAKSAAAESPPSTSALWESHGPARPSSRQSGPNLVSSPIGNTPGLPAAPSSPNLNEPVLTRVLSNGSIRSMGTYSRFDPTTYVDPAMFVPNAEPRREAPTRPASRNSALSYINENR